MKKGTLAVGVLCLVGGLTACNYEEALKTRYDDRNQQVGYYSNENTKNGNNAFIRNDNDGPITEFLERGMINNGETENRAAVDRRKHLDRREIVNPTVPYGKRDENFFERDNRFGKDDLNYHGHLNSMRPTPYPSYYNKYNGALAEKISTRAAKVEKVSDARALIYRDKVLVAVNTASKDTARIEHSVRKAVKPYTKGMDVRVTTNLSMYHRVRVIDNEIRNGGPIEPIERDMRTIFINDQIMERPINPR